MKKLTFFILCLALLPVLLNAEFRTRMLLEKIKKIKKIYISYEDAHENKKRIPINMNNKIISDELIVFNEQKRQTALMEVALHIPSKITSIEVEYIDKNNKNINKFMGIAINDRDIAGNNIYIYQDKDFSYKETREPNFEKLFNINKKTPTRTKKVSNHSNILEIESFEQDNYIDILIKNCIHKDFNLCRELKPKIIHQKKVVLYFKMKRKNTRKTNISKNIKRIQVAYDKNRKDSTHPTHLVIELNKKIHKIERVYYQNDTFSLDKSGNFEIDNQQLSYRLHINIRKKL